MTEAMQLVEQHIIRREDKRFAVLDRACFAAKNIYNAANYALRQTLFAEHRRMSYAEQEKHFKQKDLLPDQDLPMKVVQHVLKGLHHDWDSFAASCAEYKVHPEKFKARPRLPHYKDKATGRATITFSDQAISKVALRKGQIVLSGLNVSFKTRQRSVDAVRVVPHRSHYMVEVVYNKRVEKVVLDDCLYAGLDMGVDVLAALTSNKPGFEPFLVNGRPRPMGSLRSSHIQRSSTPSAGPQPVLQQVQSGHPEPTPARCAFIAPPERPHLCPQPTHRQPTASDQRLCHPRTGAGGYWQPGHRQQ
jgi:putative transposase